VRPGELAVARGRSAATREQPANQLQDWHWRAGIQLLMGFSQRLRSYA
jgi:hypothetical protein